MFKFSFILFALATLFANSFAFDVEDFDPEFGTRIVQGRNATRGQFPYYVFLKLKLPQGNAACGGSLISDEWVVTAAHCLKSAYGGEAHLGSLRAADVNEEGRVIVSFTRRDIFVHPKYFQPIVLNDIGLIKLPKPVTFTDVIKPVNLACDSVKNADVIAIGNGLMNTTAKTIAPILQYTELETISMFRCLQSFPFLVFRKSVLCVHGVQSKSACRGDSGIKCLIN